MLSFLHILSLFLGFAGVIDAYANPLACSGVCGNSHDPAVIRRSSDGTYFRFSTGNKISVATASSLSGPWVAKRSAITGGSRINKKGKDDLWAPDVTKIGDLYYLLYSVSSFGSQDSAVGYATSKDLETWTDRGTTSIASSAGKEYNAIDGNLIVDGSNYYMAFGSFWSDLFVSSLSISDEGTIKSSGGAKQLAFQSSGAHAVEAAYVFKHGDHFYLFYSAGKCCGLDKNRPAAGAEYKIMMCRSSKANGGFVDKAGKDCKSGGGTTLLPSHGWVYAPGGQGVYQDPKEGPVLYYHYVDTRIGYADGQKKFGWNKLNFGSDGWPSV